MWVVCIVRKLAGLHPSTLPPPSSARTSIQSGLLPPPGLDHPRATRRHFPNWFPAGQGRVGAGSAGLLPLPRRWKSFDGPNICLNPHGDSAETSWCGHSLLLLLLLFLLPVVAVLILLICFNSRDQRHFPSPECPSHYFICSLCFSLHRSQLFQNFLPILVLYFGITSEKSRSF